MGLRPGKCYREKRDRAYTRIAITVPKRNYISTSPGTKIRQFNMGNPLKKYNRILKLVVGNHAQIRDNAVESTRMIINRYLINKVGKDLYFMRIMNFPFHLLRENKQAQGAHADRIQKGMSHPFGRVIGRAARVRPGQVIISVLVDEEFVELAKKGLARAKARLPCDVHIEVSEDVESIGTLPKHVREEVVEVAAPTAEAAAETGKGAEKGAEAGKEAEGAKGGKAEAAGKEKGAEKGKKEKK